MPTDNNDGAVGDEDRYLALIEKRFMGCLTQYGIKKKTNGLS